MNWPVVKLGEVCEFKYGKSLAAGQRDGGEFPVYGSNGIVGGHSKPLTSGPTIVVGRKGSFGEVAYSSGSCWPIDTTYYIDSSSTNADLRWLSYRLAGLGLTSLNRAAAVPGLNREDAYRQELLLPPLDEQRRIAAILDKADGIRAKRRETLVRLADLAQALFHNMFEDHSVESVPLKSVVSGMRNGLSPSKAGKVSARVLTLSAVTQGAFDPAAAKVGTFTTEPPQEMRVSQSDFLICRGNGNVNLVGVGVHPHQDFPDLAFPDTVIAATFDPANIDPTYLMAAWNQPAVRRQIEAVARTTNGTYKINQQTLGDVEIPLPPLLDQRAFSSRLRAIPTAGMSELDELFNSLQSRAFAGQL